MYPIFYLFKGDYRLIWVKLCLISGRVYKAYMGLGFGNICCGGYVVGPSQCPNFTRSTLAMQFDRGIMMLHATTVLRHRSPAWTYQMPLTVRNARSLRKHLCRHVQNQPPDQHRDFGKPNPCTWLGIGVATIVSILIQRASVYRHPKASP